ncbi:hypothetical protein ACVW0P_001437 [Mucilaginibacter sp. UYNi724]
MHICCSYTNLVCTLVNIIQLLCLIFIFRIQVTGLVLEITIDFVSINIVFDQCKALVYRIGKQLGALVSKCAFRFFVSSIGKGVDVRACTAGSAKTWRVCINYEYLFAGFL